MAVIISSFLMAWCCRPADTWRYLNLDWLRHRTKALQQGPELVHMAPEWGDKRELVLSITPNTSLR